MDAAFMRKAFALIAKGLIEKEQFLQKEPTRYPYSKTLQHGINMFLSASCQVGCTKAAMDYADESSFLTHYITKPIADWFCEWESEMMERLKLQEEPFYAYEAFAYRRNGNTYTPSSECYEFLETQDSDILEGTFADGMPDSRKSSKISRCEEIVERLGQADMVTACVFVLPAPKYYNGQGDPKQVLRNAFARTGRVVQFINPDGDINQNKIENTVYDLYRQLGVVTLLDFRKGRPDLAAIPCIGMHLCKQVKGIVNKARFLPVYVTVDVLEGKTRVQCDAFSRRMVSYREACLEMAGLFWKNDLEQCCVNASRSPAKQKLIELKSRYYKKQDSVLLVIQSDGDTRYVWGGISDKEIGEYAMADRYCPEQINAGESKNPYMISLADSGIRIMRIRSNQEVPDYYTELSKKSADELLRYSSASGMFKYDDVYWGIHVRANLIIQNTDSQKRIWLSCILCSFRQGTMRSTGYFIPTHYGIFPFSTASQRFCRCRCI